MTAGVVALSLAALLAAAAAQHCEALSKLYKATDKRIFRNDTEVPVKVYGVGGGARAASALLAVLLRHVMHYANVVLRHERATVCELAALPLWAEVSVSAAAEAGGPRCAAHEARVSSQRPGAAPLTLRAHAHVPGAARARPACVQPFSAGPAAVRACEFATVTDVHSEPGTSNTEACDECIVILARKESDYDRSVIAAMQNVLKNNYRFRSYSTDTSFRRKLLDLQRQNVSFLFLDEALWTDAPDVRIVKMPYCSHPNGNYCAVFELVPAFRIGDGYVLDTIAPSIKEAVSHFSPNYEHLRNILQFEAVNDTKDIEEAACQWAVQHESDIMAWRFFKNTAPPREYQIDAYFCEVDEIGDYFDIIDKIVSEYIYENIKRVQFNITKTIIDCNKADVTINAILRSARPQVAGVVMWDGIEELGAALTCAHSSDVSLVTAGAPEAVGPAADLARALRHFFRKSEWTRFAILSDGSKYAKRLKNDLLSGEHFNVYEVIVTPHTIMRELEQLRNLDARVFFVNANWKITAEILCNAIRLGMTSDNTFVWIVRDWRKAECNGTQSWEDFHHYSLSRSWRGGPAFSKSSTLRKKLRRLWNITELPLADTRRWGELGGTPRAAPLADALLQVAYGFEQLYQKHKDHLDDPSSHNNAKRFFKCLDQINIAGIAQVLPFKKNNRPFIYVDEWRGSQGRSLAVWQVQNAAVDTVWAKDDDIFISNKRVRDVSKCYTLRGAGAEFTPRCHDVVIFSAVLLLVLAAPALVAARRARRNRRRRRELKNRQRNAASLVTYLVDRNSIKLLHEIGCGTFGRVHFAELKRPGQGTVLVAAKEPHESIAHFGNSEFLREACVLAPLCHKNVIRLVGVCLEDGPPIVLMEHALYLDLQKYLQERKYLIIEARLSGLNMARAIEVSDEALTRMAREAAAALAYLAAQRLVHRDVRAANCLVDRERSLKLADFGMARKLADREPEYATTRRGLFPVLWMAPESLELGVFSTASDVWALGVLFLEIVTLGARPFGNWAPARVLRYVAEGGHAPLPPDISSPARSVMLACWRRDAEARPTAEWVREYLAADARAFTPAFLAATTGHHRLPPLASSGQ